MHPLLGLSAPGRGTRGCAALQALTRLCVGNGGLKLLALVVHLPQPPKLGLGLVLEERVVQHLRAAARGGEAGRGGQRPRPAGRRRAWSPRPPRLLSMSQLHDSGFRPQRSSQSRWHRRAEHLTGGGRQAGARAGDVLARSPPPIPRASPGSQCPACPSWAACAPAPSASSSGSPPSPGTPGASRLRAGRGRGAGIWVSGPLQARSKSRGRGAAPRRQMQHLQGVPSVIAWGAPTSRLPTILTPSPAAHPPMPVASMNSGSLKGGFSRPRLPCKRGRWAAAGERHALGPSWR